MNKATGLTRLVRAFGYSCAGLAAAFRHEAAFRQEVLLALAAVPLGLWLGEGAVEKVMLAASVLAVLVVELVNSAVEAAVDRISDERHPLAGRAKDLGSAAVLLALAIAILTWTVLLLPRLLAG